MSSNQGTRHTASYLFTLWLCVLFSKLEWGKIFLKWLESLLLVQMAVRSDIFSPEDTLTCSILIGWRHSHLVSVYQAQGEKLQDDWDESYCWPGAALCWNCYCPCLEASACVFHTPVNPPPITLLHSLSLPLDLPLLLKKKAVRDSILLTFLCWDCVGSGHTC